jgi:signal peptidase I
MIRTGRRARAPLAAAIVLALGGCTSGTQVRLIEKSMEPTIRSGEYVDLDEFAFEEGEGPERGEIISFRPPKGSDDFTCGAEPYEDAPCGLPTAELSDGASLIKRVIALPGETVAIDPDGTAVVNGERLEEDYLIRCRESDECALRRPVTVPPGYYFVLGDNRPYSGDSRHFGPIDEDGIEGRVKPPR